MKTQKRLGVQTPKGETVKVNLTLGAEQQRRLFISAIMSGKTASQLVDDLIKTGLRDWSMPANLSRRGQSSTSVDSSVQVEPATEIAA